MKPKMTLKKIAAELGVSISTVSKALRDNPEISQENRDKVQAFAKLYNYRPNRVALSLKNQQSRTIGLILPEIVHNFFAKVMSGIEHVANSRGYNVIIGVSNESLSKEVMNIDLLVNGSIDGFIISASKETLLNNDYQHLHGITDEAIPLVMFDRVIHEIDCDKVVVDDIQSAKNAVGTLVQTGCRRILLLTTKDYIHIGKLRTQGYLEVLQEKGIPVEAGLIHKVNDLSDFEEYQPQLERDIHKIFDTFPDIDGIFAVNELYAITALNVARKRGLEVPEDLSVISFSNGIISRHSRPSLTTVDQRAVTIGETAAHMLLDRLEGREEGTPFETRVIKTEVLERDSTKKVKLV
ncbi:MAG: LacI family DNA-binding transcriptional regulator [Bacteroidota bacterium]